MEEEEPRREPSKEEEPSKPPEPEIITLEELLKLPPGSIVSVKVRPTPPRDE